MHLVGGLADGRITQTGGKRRYATCILVLAGRADLERRIARAAVVAPRLEAHHEEADPFLLDDPFDRTIVLSIHIQIEL